MSTRPWTLEHRSGRAGRETAWDETWMYWGSYSTEENAQRAIDREVREHDDDPTSYRILPPL